MQERRMVLLELEREELLEKWIRKEESKAKLLMQILQIEKQMEALKKGA